VSKKNQVLASLVKPTVVANTRAWSFIVEKLQSKIVVIHGLCTQSWVVYPKFGIIWGYRTGKMVKETITRN